MINKNKNNSNESVVKFRKALLVYNPKSGNAMTILNNFDLITSKLLEKKITLTLYSINRNYDELVNILKNEKYDILILSGGDGTLSRCLSQLYNNNVEFPDVAIFPTGTSNDLGKSLQIGDDINSWIENITDGNAKEIDFGLINNKTIFLSSYAGGIFTKISYSTDKNLKKAIGKVAYYLNGITELANIKEFELNMNIVDDGSGNSFSVSEKAVLYMILNGKSVGGFNQILDTADVSDGLMNILIVKNIENSMDVPQILLDLINNNLINNDYVRTLVAKKCEISQIKEDISVSIDGEEGINETSEIEFISGKLRIFRKNS